MYVCACVVVGMGVHVCVCVDRRVSAWVVGWVGWGWAGGVVGVL